MVLVRRPVSPHLLDIEGFSTREAPAFDEFRRLSSIRLVFIIMITIVVAVVVVVASVVDKMKWATLDKLQRPSSHGMSCHVICGQDETLTVAWAHMLIFGRSMLNNPQVVQVQFHF